MGRPDFYTVHQGRHRWQIPRSLDSFQVVMPTTGAKLTYRVHDGQVEMMNHAGEWQPSILLTISSPIGRRGRS